MSITARISDADRTQIVFTDELGREWSGIRCHYEGTTLVIDSDGEIPRRVSAYIAAGNTALAYQAPALVADAVKAEAQRRIIALTGKTNLQDCMIKQFNALMRAGQLTDKRVSGEALTPEEEAEAAALRGFADRIKAIRAASDAIERIEPIPDTYRDDKNWPA